MLFMTFIYPTEIAFLWTSSPEMHKNEILEA